MVMEAMLEITAAVEAAAAVLALLDKEGMEDLEEGEALLICPLPWRDLEMEGLERGAEEVMPMQRLALAVSALEMEGEEDSQVVVGELLWAVHSLSERMEL
jgi:hypothetical protein